MSNTVSELKKSIGYQPNPGSGNHCMTCAHYLRQPHERNMHYCTGFGGFAVRALACCDRYKTGKQSTT